MIGISARRIVLASVMAHLHTNILPHADTPARPAIVTPGLANICTTVLSLPPLAGVPQGASAGFRARVDEPRAGQGGARPADAIWPGRAV